MPAPKPERTARTNEQTRQWREGAGSLAYSPDVDARLLLVSCAAATVLALGWALGERGVWQAGGVGGMGWLKRNRPAAPRRTKSEAVPV